MRILMVASEAVPFSKSGGLADMVSSLSAVMAAQGHDCRIVLPLYGSTAKEGFASTPYGFSLTMEGRTERCTLHVQTLDAVQYWFVGNRLFSERPGLYGDASQGTYPDNHLRFALLCKASLEACKAWEWVPDIIHAHDWMTALVVAMKHQDSSGFFAKTRTVFTIHNLGYQGDVSRLDALSCALQLDKRMFSGKGRSKRFNFLRTGIAFADEITTVSPTYAREIQSPEYGCGMEDLLVFRCRNLHGILNGIDTSEWNPASDPNLALPYSADDMTGKAAAKRKLQESFGLAVDPDVPVVGMVSRIAEQKGFVELVQGSPCALEQMLTDLHMQMVIVGTGDKAIEEKLTALAELHANLAVRLVFSNTAAHLVEAGSDLFLMPSRYEPCGLNQMYSLRYGTLVLARRTGGLADSIIDLQDNPQEATGFLFDEMSGNAIYQTVARALAVHHDDHSTFLAMRERGMAVDFSWEHSAQRYLKLYTGEKG